MECDISSCAHQSSQTQECALREPGTMSEEIVPQARHRSGSLVVASLELGKVLADHGVTTFRAQGTCMYPCVRPGDILHIDSRSVKEIALGDIAVFRRENYLFGHRAIDKGTHNGNPYIITRPDRMMRGSDGPSYDDDVLGKVSSIERNGIRIDPARQQHPTHTRFYFAARLKLIEYSLALRSCLIDSLPRFQRGALYKYAIRSFLDAKGSKLSFIVQLPFAAKPDFCLYHPMPAEEFDVSSLAWQGRKVESWRLALYMEGGRHPAAWASFVLRPPECPFPGWWQNDLQVRVRYRGAGFEEELARKAEKMLARGGCKLQKREK